jgi:hypothetical protein
MGRVLRLPLTRRLEGRGSLLADFLSRGCVLKGAGIDLGGPELPEEPAGSQASVDEAAAPQVRLVLN